MVQIISEHKQPTFTQKLAGAVGKGLELGGQLYQQHQQKQAIGKVLGPEYQNLPADFQKLALEAKFKGDETAQKLKQSQTIVRGIEHQYGLAEGSLAAFESNPSVALQVAKGRPEDLSGLIEGLGVGQYAGDENPLGGIGETDNRSFTERLIQGERRPKSMPGQGILKPGAELEPEEGPRVNRRPNQPAERDYSKVTDKEILKIAAKNQGLAEKVRTLRDAAVKRKKNQQLINDFEDQVGAKRGKYAAFVDNPSMAIQAYKAQNKTVDPFKVQQQKRLLMDSVLRSYNQRLKELDDEIKNVRNPNSSGKAEVEELKNQRKTLRAERDKILDYKKTNDLIFGEQEESLEEVAAEEEEELKELPEDQKVQFNPNNRAHRGLAEKLYQKHGNKETVRNLLKKRYKGL